MFAHVEALVRGVDYEGVVKHVMVTQIVKNAAYVAVKAAHHLGIVAHVAFEFPAGQILALE